jgi:hypothetical protein
MAPAVHRRIAPITTIRRVCRRPPACTETACRTSTTMAIPRPRRHRAGRDIGADRTEPHDWRRGTFEARPTNDDRQTRSHICRGKGRLRSHAVAGIVAGGGIRRPAFLREDGWLARARQRAAALSFLRLPGVSLGLGPTARQLRREYRLPRCGFADAGSARCAPRASLARARALRQKQQSPLPSHSINSSAVICMD